MIYYTFSVPIDRGPDAWSRYGTETIQLGPYANEERAWEGLRATIGDHADNASLTHIEPASASPSPRLS